MADQKQTIGQHIAGLVADYIVARESFNEIHQQRTERPDDVHPRGYVRKGDEMDEALRALAGSIDDAIKQLAG